MRNHPRRHDNAVDHAVAKVSVSMIRSSLTPLVARIVLNHGGHRGLSHASLCTSVLSVVNPTAHCVRVTCQGAMNRSNSNSMLLTLIQAVALFNQKSHQGSLCHRVGLVIAATSFGFPVVHDVWRPKSSRCRFALRERISNHHHDCGATQSLCSDPYTLSRYLTY